MPSPRDGKGRDGTKLVVMDYFHGDNNANVMSKWQASSSASLMDMQNGIKEEVSSFLAHTSFTALAQIYKANCVWKRLLWTVLVLGMFGWLVVQCYWLLEKYYKYPMEVKLDFKAASALDFPSVTICNLNPIKEESIDQEPFQALKKYVNPETHDFLFHEVMSSWISAATGTNAFEGDRKPNPRKRQSSRTTTPEPTSREQLSKMNSSSSSINLTWAGPDSTEPGILDHDISTPDVLNRDMPPTGNLNHDMPPPGNLNQDMPPPDNLSHDDPDDFDGDNPQPPSEAPDCVSLYLRALWRQCQYSMNTEDFNRKLKESYLNYQKSMVSKWKNSTKESNSTEDSSDAHNQTDSRSNCTLDIKWDHFFQNSTFNKWNMLNSSKPSRFYEQKDDECAASLTYAFITARLDPELVENSGHQKEDFIASCEFNGYMCSPQNFSYFHSHKFGNCYTFNSQKVKVPMETRFPGPERGLRLQLFLDQKNYVANLATEAGAKIMVHKKGSFPFPEDEGISVLPGRSTSISLRQHSYSRLPPPHGKCGNQGQTTDYYQVLHKTDYSKLSCLKSCYQDIFVKYCNCSVPFFIVLDSTSVCDLTVNVTEQCVTGMQKYQKWRFTACDKKCPQPCEEISYNVFISAAKWPSTKYQPYLNMRLHQTNWKYRNLPDSDQQFTKLQIYFRDLIYHHVEEQRSYESMNLISDLGGQLGLWLGLSAITLGELCSCLFAVGRLLPFKCWGSKQTQSHLKINRFPAIQPTTQEEMREGMSPATTKYTPPYYLSISEPTYTNV